MKLFPIWQSLTIFINIMEGYWKIANGSEEIDKNRYIEILKDVLNMHKHPYGNVEEMWNLLIELSRGAADKISRETLEELLQNTESSWKICNYTHLLREIEEYDYFSEQAQNEPEDFGGGILEVWEKEALSDMTGDKVMAA